MGIYKFQGEHRFLSNFYLIPDGIEYEGILYPTVEHGFQAAKSDNVDVRRAIAQESTPSLAKSAGQKVSLRDDWNKLRIPIMGELLCIKFNKEPFRLMSMNTYPDELIEGNNWGDRFWGVCDGEGKNWLGELLMEIREQLMKRSYSIADRRKASLSADYIKNKYGRKI